MIDAEEIEADGNPLVHIFLNDVGRNHASFDDALDAVLTGAEMEGLFLEHGNHGLGERRESGIAKHSELILAVAINEVRIDEEVEPIVDVLIEGTEQTLLIEGAALEHFLSFDATGIAEMIHE